ncbi:MAG: hypothetical protein M3R38_12550 [Actinomycetota bacterium]|nr:hypothetical protein [Actinomycetota bacterium]
MHKVQEPHFGTEQGRAYAEALDALDGRTLGGIPVFNVSLHVLRQEGIERPCHLVEV